MTHTDTYYQAINPITFNNSGRCSKYYSCNDALLDIEFLAKRARKMDIGRRISVLIVKVTTATITDDNGWFVSETTDRKAIGLYDNGQVTMY